MDDRVAVHPAAAANADAANQSRRFILFTIFCRVDLMSR
jgi:hypothetical protein